MRLFFRAAAFASLAFTGPVLAADPEGRFALRSLATLTCGEVVDAIERSEGEDLQNLVSQLSIWLGGYLTNLNRTTPDIFDIVPFAADRDVLAIIVNRCEQLPAEVNFEAVTADVVALLSVFAVPSESPIRLFDGTIPLRESVIVRVQERLIELGHLVGPADGIVGPRTRTAISAFQTERESVSAEVLDIDGLLGLLME